MRVARPLRSVSMVATTAAFAFLLAACDPGATIAVTTTGDELNTDGDCSLREAVRAANLNAAVDACPKGTGPDIVSVPAGTYPLTVEGIHEGEGLTGDLDVFSPMTIRGAGKNATFLDGAGFDRVLDVLAGGNATVEDVTLQNGVAPPGRRGGAVVVLEGGSLTMRRSIVKNNSVSDGPNRWPDGGGIYNDGTANIVDTTVSNNVAGGNEGSGGGIWNSGTLTLNRSTVSNNLANGSNSTTYLIDGGGGIFSSGTLTVVQSTISGNTSNYRGGGIATAGAATIDRSTISTNVGRHGGGIYATAVLTMLNTTISGNLAKVHGGGVWSSVPDASLANVTIASNTSDSDQNGSGDGGGLYLGGGVTRIRNSLFNTNQDPGGEAPGCSTAAGTFQSEGYNKFGGLTGCVVSGDLTGNIVGGNALLGPLANNGGLTQTHALLAGSPAIDAANPAAPGGGGTACPTAYQRAVVRPQDGNGDTISRCDMGAFELSP